MKEASRERDISKMFQLKHVYHSKSIYLCKFKKRRKSSMSIDIKTSAINIQMYHERLEYLDLL